MPGPVVAHGEIFSVEELCREGGHSEIHDGKSVRVLARVERYDADAARVLVAHPDGPDKGRLVVDLGLVPDGDVPKEGSLFQYIGECQIPHQTTEDSRHVGSGQLPPPSLVIKARVARNVDGVDVKMYYMALRSRRMFFKMR